MEDAWSAYRAGSVPVGAVVIDASADTPVDHVVDRLADIYQGDAHAGLW